MSPPTRPFSGAIFLQILHRALGDRPRYPFRPAVPATAAPGAGSHGPRAPEWHAGRAVNESKELAQWPGPWHPHWTARARPPGTVQIRTARGVPPFLFPPCSPLLFPPCSPPCSGGGTMKIRIRNMVTDLLKGYILFADGYPPCPGRPPDCPDARRARNPGALGTGAPGPSPARPPGSHHPAGGRRALQCRHRPGSADRPGMRRPLAGPACRRAAGGAPARGRPFRAPW
jgi:hypothetical protein